MSRASTVLQRVLSRAARLIDGLVGKLMWNDVLPVFVPCSALAPHDAVELVFRQSKGLLQRKHRAKWVDQATNHLIDSEGDFGGLRVPSRVSLFAHPLKDRRGFLANASSTLPGRLNLGWWKITGHRYQLVYAHVCNGSEVLSRTAWRAFMPNWVSFNGVLDVYPSPRGTECWCQFAVNAIAATAVARTASGLKERIRAELILKMADVHDLYDRNQGDVLTLLHLQKAINHLRSSDDY